MKTCKTCGKRKTNREFYRHPTTKDGLFPECKKCNIARTEGWQKRNPELKRDLQRQYWHRNKEKLLALWKQSWNKRDFGGLRKEVLSRDNYRCVKCGMSQEEHLNMWGVDINVDHINRDRKENTMDNLQTLCLKCHGKKDNLKTTRF